MRGVFTVYFFNNTDPPSIEEETMQILITVNEEIAKDDWNGVRIVYNNNPFFQEESGVVDGDGKFQSFPRVAIVGVVVGIIGLASVALYFEYCS